MKAATTKVITVTLTLSEEEASWLEDVMQNPLHGQLPADEGTVDRGLRISLFNALQQVLN